MLGIEDPWVWLAYLGSILVTLICLLYGWIRRNTADDELSAADRLWALEEQQVEDALR
ncbi:symporter small accessory protein [Marichromatium gracile]|uniref:symporter small accessory protein n=1 Tax=Marichromatium gracile TaxID=1048 RepID=UPI0019113FB9|nr:symporter small accessory protein [Marichromatium gracile]